MSELPDWVKDQLAIRAAEAEMAARRKAYDDWARAYADCGTTKEETDDTDHRRQPHG